MGGSWQRDMTRRQIAEATEAALGNEQLTRQRVAVLERRSQEDHAVLAILSRGFWGRLKWLALGR